MKRFKCDYCSWMFSSDEERPMCLRCGSKDVTQIGRRSSSRPSDTLEGAPQLKKPPVQRWESGEPVSARTPEAVEQEPTVRRQRGLPTNPFEQAVPRRVDENALLGRLLERLSQDPERLREFRELLRKDLPIFATDPRFTAQYIALTHMESLIRQLAPMVADVLVLEHSSERLLRLTAKLLVRLGLMDRLAQDERFRSVPGPAGRDGTDGKDGRPGRDGVDGKDGRAGKDGAPGRDGRDGQPAPRGPIMAMVALVAIVLVWSVFRLASGSGIPAPSVDTAAVEMRLSEDVINEQTALLEGVGQDPEAARDSATRAFLEHKILQP